LDWLSQFLATEAAHIYAQLLNNSSGLQQSLQPTMVHSWLEKCQQLGIE